MSANSETMKRITIVACVSVTLTVDADIAGGEVDIINVVAMAGMPSAREVMEALDHHGDLSQLDEAYEGAGGALP